MSNMQNDSQLFFENRAGKLLANANYFERIFSLGMITGKNEFREASSIYNFSHNILFDLNLVILIRKFYEICTSKCECTTFINQIWETSVEENKRSDRTFCIRIPCSETIKNILSKNFLVIMMAIHM